MVLNRIAQLCAQFDARQGESIDLNDWMGFLVFDGERLLPTQLPIMLLTSAGHLMQSRLI
jgi:hypothetical protein